VGQFISAEALRCPSGSSFKSHGMMDLDESKSFDGDSAAVPTFWGFLDSYFDSDEL
jgi:hypothetical protein